MNPKRFLPVLALSVASFPAWAAQLTVPGIENFHQVNKNIYRGAQPSQEGFQALAKMGIKTVVDLRRENEDGEHLIAAERRMVEAAGMRYVSVPMNGMAAPTEEQVSKVLSEFESGDPVFVHCRRGKDRTGTVIACYRISHDGWQNKAALNEAKSIGLHWIEVGMKGYIQSFRGVNMQVAKAPAAAAPVATAVPLAAAVGASQ